MKKKLSLMLALLALTGVVVSCGETKTDPKTTDTDAGKTTETEPAETRTPHKVPVDTLDFNKEEYNMLFSEWGPYNYYFFAEENSQDGDVMNDALYKRQLDIEEALNVKIVPEYAPDYISGTPKILQETVLADEDAYDQVFLHCIQGVAASVSGGYLYNIDTLRYIDTDAEWWNRAQMDNLKLGEGTYYIVNDMMIPCPYVIYFNKGMISELDLDDPYQLVFNKKWTLEKFADMIKEATTDSDGDGQMTPADRYGLSAGDDSNYISFVPGCGQYITERDEEGKITLSINTPKMQDLMEKFVDYTTKNYILFQPSGQTENRLTLDSGRILFFISGLTDAEGMRDYTVDFGFLPFPMYDEEQEDYMSLDWGGLSGVPASIKNPDMVGAVLELYAYESKNEVIPTYYDKVLEGKLSRDENSVKMIDLLFDTIVYEIGGNYFGFEQGFNALFYALPNVAIRNRNPVFSSLYSSSEMPSKTVISNFYKALDTQEHAEE